MQEAAKEKEFVAHAYATRIIVRQSICVESKSVALGFDFAFSLQESNANRDKKMLILINSCMNQI